MHEICPKCERPLTKKRSWHYCKKISFDELLAGKPDALKKTFQLLLNKLKSWPGVQASATKTCAVFLAGKTFLVVKVMKQDLDLKFVLPHQTDAFPIYKTAKYGNKLEHYIRLHDEDDLDNDVWWLLRQAYEHGPSHREGTGMG